MNLDDHIPPENSTLETWVLTVIKIFGIKGPACRFMDNLLLKHGKDTLLVGDVKELMNRLVQAEFKFKEDIASGKLKKVYGEDNLPRPGEFYERWH
jgi:hypothetical protein